MQIKSRWIGAVAALVMLGAQAGAETRVSTATGPQAGLLGAFSSLMGAEQAALRQVPQGDLSALAKGPAPAATAAPGNPARKIDYSYRWLMSQKLDMRGEDWECLRQALYFEARGQSLEGQFAVAEVVLNRVDSPEYPDTVCGVVSQSAGQSCQFSYFCDGRSDRMHEVAAVEVAGRIAAVMLDGGERRLTGGATFFHSRAADPVWAARMQQTASIGAHVFYAAN